jgi:transglutaminase-like putative cysteine protease
MRYKITHATQYVYTEPISVCHNEAYLVPRTTERQSCEYHRLQITPHPSSAGRRTDFFENVVNHFSFNEGFRELTIKAVSRVHVLGIAARTGDASPRWEDVAGHSARSLDPDELAAAQFRFASPRVAVTDALRSYAAESFRPGRPVLAALADLSSRIHADFLYDAAASHVNTTVEEFLQSRRGVCQDFAHLAIGMLRSVGLPARYVSGYLRTEPAPGTPRLIGADASHAWVSAWCGELGWVDLDPTNNVLPSADHITVAWGRDYSDVAPIKGVYTGGGPHTMHVSVEVQPLSE